MADPMDDKMAEANIDAPADPPTEPNVGNVSAPAPDKQAIATSSATPDAGLYASGQPPEDLCAKFCREHEQSGGTAKEHSAKIHPLPLVLANVAAPLYLYTQYKGRADLWEKLLSNVPQEILQGPTLDVSCERGVALMKIAEHKKAMAGTGAHVAPAYAIDKFEKDDPNVTAENAVALGLAPHVVIHRCDAEKQKFPFKDHSFGMVICSLALALYHSTERKAAMREMVRVCRPGGRIIVVVRKGYGSSLREVLREAGWSEKYMDTSWAGPGIMFGMWPAEVLTAQAPLAKA